MRRPLIAALGVPAVAALFLLGGASTASASEHKGGDCATKCRPPKTPPPGGWPCRLDHSCGTKHHYPVCPPTEPPVKPPAHHHPKPTPVVHHHLATPKVTVASPTPEQLPRTGSNVLELLVTAAGLTGAGVGFKRLGRVR